MDGSTQPIPLQLILDRNEEEDETIVLELAHLQGPEKIGENRKS